MEPKEIGEKLKEEWTSYHKGGCKLLSGVYDCQCHLCLIDKLVEIASKNKKLLNIEFERGEKVKLRCDPFGYDMCVSKLLDEDKLMNPTEKHLIKTVWLNKDGNLQSAIFHKTLLMKIK